MDAVWAQVAERSWLRAGEPFGAPLSLRVEYGPCGSATRGIRLPSGAMLYLEAMGPALVRAEGQLAMEALRAALQWTLVHFLEPFSGLLVHAAVIRMPNGEAELFYGPSGAGKTTLARNAGENALAEENAVVWKREGRWWVCGTPWWSDGGRPGSPVAHPLRRIARLLQGESNAFQLKGAASLLPSLARQVYCPLEGPSAHLQRHMLQLLAETETGEICVRENYVHVA